MIDPLALRADGVRVLLIGTGSHPDDSELPSVPAVRRSVSALQGALIDRCGVAPTAVRVVHDPADPREFGAAVSEAANQAESVLLIYFVGHGLIGPDGELYLAAASTASLVEGLTYQALPYAAVQEALSRSRARSTVVVLDCCFSGRASGAPGAAAADGFTASAVRGAHVLCSAARDEKALARPGQDYTGFTGELLRLLDSGDPTRGRMLSLTDVYECLDRRLPAAGYPRPRQHVSDTSGQLVLAPNAAFPAETVAGRASSAPVAPDDGTTCPYRGMDPYESGDAPYFFGRTTAIVELIDQIGQRISEGGPFVLLGPSGSGKSSLLRAGVAPAIGRGAFPGSGAWRKHVFTPGEHPTERLATVLGHAPGTDQPQIEELVAAARGEQGSTDRTVLIVDQFEEVFTACRDPRDQQEFIHALCAAASRDEGDGAPAVVILAIRADFYDRCLAYPELVAALRANTGVVAPLTDAELHDVIEKPAHAAGLTLEHRLPELVLRDLRVGHSEMDTAGALPLLSYALMLTWQRRNGKELTLAGYQADGGIWESVSSQAEATYKALDPSAQEIARRTLLRMVRIGTTTDHTRRRVPLADFQSGGTAEDTASARAVLDAFARARLVTVDADAATITHEALLRAWPLLGQWMEQDRAGLVVRQQISDASARWVSLEYDPDALYRGRALAEAELWREAGTSQIELTELEREFLDAGSAQRRAQLEREQRQRDRERRQNRRLRVLVSALAFLLVIALSTAVLLVVQRRELQASQREEQAQLRLAAARLLVSQADAVRASDPRRALQLGIAAYRINSDAATRASLVNAVTTMTLAATMNGIPVGFSSDRTHVLSVSTAASRGGFGNTVVSWAVSAATSTRSDGEWDLVGTGQLTEMVLSADGRTLVTGEIDGTLRLWDVSDPLHGRPIGSGFGSGPDPTALALSSDGHYLVMGTDDGSLVQWDLTDPTRPKPIGEPGRVATRVQQLAFSPRARLLLVGVGDDPPQVWQVQVDGRLRQLATLPMSLPPSRNDILDPNQVTDIEFSPDGRIAAIAAIGGVQLWDLSEPVQPRTLGVPLAGTSTAAFSPDGNTLAVHNGDGAVDLWDVTGPVPSRTGSLAVGGAAKELLFAPDAQWLLVTENALRSSLWTMRPLHWAVTRRAEWALNLPGTALAVTEGWVATNGPGNQVVVRTTTGELLATLATSADSGVTALAANAEGTLLAVGGGRTGDKAVVELWDVSDPRRPTRKATPSGGTLRAVTGLAFTDDGDRLAVSDADYIVQFDVGAAGLTKTMGNPWPYYHRPLAVSLSKHTMARIKATVLAGQTPIGGQVELWPVGTVGPAGGSGAYELPGPGSTGSTVVFDRAGTVLAVGGLDGSLTLWDPLADYAHRRSLPVSAHASAVSAIAFTTDGQLAMTAGYDGTLTAWLISDSGPFRLGGLIQAHTGEVTRIAFSADNRTVFTTGNDGMLRSWEISRLIDLLADPTRIACALSGGGLEREAWTTFVVNEPYRETCS